MKETNILYLETNFCQFLIDEYTDSLYQNEKSDFYNDFEPALEKIISLAQINSSNYIQEDSVIRIKTKFLPNKKMKKMNKNIKMSLYGKNAKIDKNFVNEIISRRNEVLKEIRKKKYLEYNVYYKFLNLIKIALILKARKNKSKFIILKQYDTCC
jgi:hypothetical protein